MYGSNSNNKTVEKEIPSSSFEVLNNNNKENMATDNEFNDENQFNNLVANNNNNNQDNASSSLSDSETETFKKFKKMRYTSNTTQDENENEKEENQSNSNVLDVITNQYTNANNNNNNNNHNDTTRITRYNSEGNFNRIMSFQSNCNGNANGNNKKKSKKLGKSSNFVYNKKTNDKPIRSTKSGFLNSQISKQKKLKLHKFDSEKCIAAVNSENSIVTMSNVKNVNNNNNNNNNKKQLVKKFKSNSYVDKFDSSYDGFKLSDNDDEDSESEDESKNFSSENSIKNHIFSDTIEHTSEQCEDLIVIESVETFLFTYDENENCFKHRNDALEPPLTIKYAYDLHRAKCFLPTFVRAPFFDLSKKSNYVVDNVYEAIEFNDDNELVLTQTRLNNDTGDDEEVREDDDDILIAHILNSPDNVQITIMTEMENVNNGEKMSYTVIPANQDEMECMYEDDEECRSDDEVEIEDKNNVKDVLNKIIDHVESSSEEQETEENDEEEEKEAVCEEEEKEEEEDTKIETVSECDDHKSDNSEDDMSYTQDGDDNDEGQIEENNEEIVSTPDQNSIFDSHDEDEDEEEDEEKSDNEEDVDKTVEIEENKIKIIEYMAEQGEIQADRLYNMTQKENEETIETVEFIKIEEEEGESIEPEDICVLPTPTIMEDVIQQQQQQRKKIEIKLNVLNGDDNTTNKKIDPMCLLNNDFGLSSNIRQEMVSDNHMIINIDLNFANLSDFQIENLTQQLEKNENNRNSAQLSLLFDYISPHLNSKEKINLQIDQVILPHQSTTITTTNNKENENSNSNSATTTTTTTSISSSSSNATTSTINRDVSNTSVYGGESSIQTENESEIDNSFVIDDSNSNNKNIQSSMQDSMEDEYKDNMAVVDDDCIVENQYANDDLILERRKPRPSYLIEKNTHIFGGDVDEDNEDEFFISSGAVYQSWPYIYEPGFKLIPIIELDEIHQVLSKSDTVYSYLDDYECRSETNECDDDDYDDNELADYELPSYSLKNFGINLIHCDEKKMKKKRRKRRRSKSFDNLHQSSSYESEDESDEMYSSTETSDDSDTESIREYNQRHAIGFSRNLNTIALNGTCNKVCSHLDLLYENPNADDDERFSTSSNHGLDNTVAALKKKYLATGRLAASSYANNNNNNLRYKKQIFFSEKNLDVYHNLKYGFPSKQIEV